jgi:hypothetical protein
MKKLKEFDDDELDEPYPDDDDEEEEDDSDLESGDDY